MATFGGGFGAATTAGHNPNKDVEIASPPDDSISSLSFSPTANHLIATSWDNKVRSPLQPCFYACGYSSQVRISFGLLPPDDSISSLLCSPTANHLVATRGTTRSGLEQEVRILLATNDVTILLLTANGSGLTSGTRQAETDRTCGMC